MAYKIDFGGWGSVFAVPTAIVDNGLKLASEKQLKVLLYILRHQGDEISDDIIAEALSIHPEDVSDAVIYWADRGAMVKLGNELTMGTAKEHNKETTPVNEHNTEETPQDLPVRTLPRNVRLDSANVARILRTDSSAMFLVNEAQRILAKVLSNVDTAVLLGLYDVYGLPIEVIVMLMEYCSKIGKGNIKYIEKTGIAWANEEIRTIELAEEKIKRYDESSEAFRRVALVFGLSNSGTPTKNQTEFSNVWVNEWGFSDEVLRIAYERCVDKKGEMRFSYINGILKRFYEDKLFTADDIEKTEKARSVSRKKKNNTDEPSYDLESYEKKSIFD